MFAFKSSIDTTGRASNSSTSTFSSSTFIARSRASDSPLPLQNLKSIFAHLRKFCSFNIHPLPAFLKFYDAISVEKSPCVAEKGRLEKTRTRLDRGRGGPVAGAGWRGQT